MPLLELSDVAFAYPGGDPVLRDVSFRIEAGKRVALLGANGAGKSTLLQLCNGLLLATAGTVRVAGHVVREDTLRAVRAHVGFVFQEPDDQLFLPTVLEDVAFGPLNSGAARDAAAAQARTQLEQLGIAQYGARAAHHLSGGEKRLAALATVLVSRPDLLVLDEPTSELDARGRRRTVDLLRERSETLLLATHDLEVAAALCERALVLEAGRLVWDGPLRGLGETELERLGLRAAL